MALAFAWKCFQFYGFLVSVPSWLGHIFKFSQQRPLPRPPTSNCSLGIVYSNFLSQPRFLFTRYYCSLSLFTISSEQLVSTFGSNIFDTLALKPVKFFFAILDWRIGSWFLRLLIGQLFILDWQRGRWSELIPRIPIQRLAQSPWFKNCHQHECKFSSRVCTIHDSSPRNTIRIQQYFWIPSDNDLQTRGLITTCY